MYAIDHPAFSLTQPENFPVWRLENSPTAYHYRQIARGIAAAEECLGDHLVAGLREALRLIAQTAEVSEGQPAEALRVLGRDQERKRLSRARRRATASPL